MICLYLSNDYLSIFDGPDIILNQTGRITPAEIISSNSNVTINFRSGSKGGEKGFEIIVSLVLRGIVPVQKS